MRRGIRSGRRARVRGGVLLGAALVIAGGGAGCSPGEVTGPGGLARADASPGGGGGGGGGAGEADGAPGAGLSAEIAFCAEEINRYRAMREAAPLERSAALEEYAATGAAINHESGEPHKYFADTGGGGIALAENEIPRWSVSQFGSVENVIRQGLALMFDEGPGGPHHDNMVGPYGTVGCGIHLDGDLVTVVQDFGS